MNKDQIEGRLEQAKGKVKEVAGNAVGNDRLKNEGRADQAGGKVQATYGDAKERAKDQAKQLIDKI
jgi:uncharacterized protein YjbJ (UPF0337 family)